MTVSKVSQIQMPDGTTLKLSGAYDWIGTKAEYEAAYEAGEIQADWVCFITDDETPIKAADNDLSNITTAAKEVIRQDVEDMYNCLYEGINLETKFADEIANYSSVYTWLQARKNANNYEGIKIGDYFYVAMSAGSVGSYTVAAQTFKCRIIGLNTYKNCGDTAIGNMIYVKSDQCCDTAMTWNPSDNNNGTSTQNNPWLASMAYGLLNGVNNYSTSAYGSAKHGVSAANKGILQLLPTELQNVLVTKRGLLDSRYSSSGLLTYSTTWAWGDMGKLWLPNECEVYGTQVRSNLGYGSGYWNPENGLAIQFPWFRNNCQHRISTLSSGSRCYWWLSSAASFNSTDVCYVNGHGYANSYTATNSGYYLPLCFCI